jgi:hypothetical protein
MVNVPIPRPPGTSRDDCLSELDVAVIISLRDPEYEAFIAQLLVARAMIPELVDVTLRPSTVSEPRLRRYTLQYNERLTTNGKTRRSVINRDNQLSIGTFCVGAIGAADAMNAAQYLAEDFRPKCILVCGIGGGLYPRAVGLGDVAFAVRAARLRLRPTPLHPLAFETEAVHNCDDFWCDKISDFGFAYDALPNVGAAAVGALLPRPRIKAVNFATTDAPVYDVHLRDSLAAARHTVVEQEVGVIMYGVDLLHARKEAKRPAYLKTIGQTDRRWQKPSVIAFKGVTDYCDATAPVDVRAECARRAAAASILFIHANRRAIKDQSI